MFTNFAITRRFAVAVVAVFFVMATTAPGQTLAPNHPVAASGVYQKNPALACDTLVRIEPAQIPSRYVWPVYWSLAVNFKAFVKGDPSRPYVCLRLFGRDRSTGGYVDLSQTGKGIPITGCSVIGNVPMSMRTLPGLGTVIGVASFGSRPGYIACDLDLAATVNNLFNLGQINAMPDGSAPKLETFHSYDAFAYAIVASVQKTLPVTFAQYLPGRSCPSEAAVQGFPTACDQTSYLLDVSPGGSFDQHTVTDGQDSRTPALRVNTHGFADEYCMINPALVMQPLIWSSYRGYIAGYGDHLHHLMLDITNTHTRVMCDLPGGTKETPFYTGRSTLYLGGTPNARAAWGELYEVTADPGGSSTGTDGVK